jgi:hypothetical protein
MNMFGQAEELKIGQVVEVSGTSIKVEISESVSELTKTYEGRVYPIGQIGSLVKIHYGRKIIFGLVTMLRMRSEELIQAGMPVTVGADQRVMEVQLLAEGHWINSKKKLDFKRGIKTYPLPQQSVYILTNREITKLYQSAEGDADRAIDPLIPFAVYSASESTQCRANIDKMFGMHCAILGSTGSGKSGTVAAIIHSVLEHKHEEQTISPQIIIIDPHGEYGSAFKDRATLYRAYGESADEESDSIEIKLPYWLMSSDEIASLIIGKTESSATNQNNVVYKALSHARMVAAGIVKPAPSSFGDETIAALPEKEEAQTLDGFETSDVLAFNRDKPRSFCWNEFENHIRFIQGAKTAGLLHVTKTATDLNKISIPSVLDKLKVLRQDPRLSFMMSNWNNHTEQLNLPKVLNQLIGNGVTPDEVQNSLPTKDINVIDISGLPNEIAGPLVAMIARILFQYKVHQTNEEKLKDPLLIVCEEAHRYVPDKGDAQYGAAQEAVKRIAREGRKYGIGLMLVSQRPADVDSTVISQCGTWVVLRLTNSADQQHVSRFLPDGLSGMVGALPILSQQEAIFVGEGAALPSRIKIRDLTSEQLPSSNTIPFAEGWFKERLTEGELSSICERMTE